MASLNVFNIIYKTNYKFNKKNPNLTLKCVVSLWQFNVENNWNLL